MGVMILVGRASDMDRACLFDSVTDTAFGPVFYDSKGPYDSKGLTAEEVAERFLDWLLRNYGDSRAAGGKELEDLYARFREERGLVE